MQQVELVERTVPARTPNRLRVFVVVAAILVVVLVAIAIGFARKWPFSREAITAALQQESGRNVRIENFRRTYFPHPGAVADGVTFLSREGPGKPPPITVQKLTVEGNYLGLLAHHLNLVRAEGLRVLVPPFDERSSTTSFLANNTTLSIGKFVADGAEIDFASSHAGEPPLGFRMPKLALSSISPNRPVSFQSTVLVPLPPATVDVSGKVGPVKTGSISQTPLSGTYTVKEADLGVFGGIAGKLSGKGKFDGVLQHINTSGDTDTPDFMVTRSGHKVHVNAHYQAVVNGLNGDVALQPVTANFGKTTIVAQGKIEGESAASNQGKTVSLTFYANRARIQDLLRLFAKEDPPSMMGPIVFRGQVRVPPEDRPFLKRVRLQGDFGISGAQYTNPKTQKDVDVASAKARGEAEKVEDENDKDHNDNYDPGKVLTNLKGHVVMQDAVANLSNLSFDVPGASAHAAGTYNILTQHVDMQGTVDLQTTLSKATTGAKSVLLKIMQPLMRDRKGHGSVVNLKVTGTYHNPNFSITPATK